MTRIVTAAAGALAVLLFAAPAFATTIFVSNEKDNTITVVDADTLQVTKTIKVSRRPRGIMLSPDFKELFVAAERGQCVGGDVRSLLADGHHRVLLLDGDACGGAELLSAGVDDGEDRGLAGLLERDVGGVDRGDRVGLGG